MAAITSKGLLFEATLLQQRLAQVEQNISDMPIAKQLPAINEVAVVEQKKFQELQKKVELFFSKADLFDIEDSVQISQRLAQGATHLKNVSETQEKLMIYSEIYSNAQEALKSTPSDRNAKLQSVVNCITQTMTKNTFNPGILLALTDLQKNLSQAILGQKKEEPKTPVISQNSNLDLLAKEFNDEYKLLMQQKGSYQELHERFLDFFGKMRIASNNNPSLKENGTFFNVYDPVFNLLNNLQLLQAKTDMVLSKKMSVAFKALLTATEKTNSQQAISVPVKQEEKTGTDLKKTIEELLRALIHLKTEKSNAVEQASLILKALYQKNSSCIFTMSGTQSMLIVSRVFFHLYHIHRIEDPSLLKEDKDYGFKAFIGTFNGFTATNSQRSLALQRTVAELALSGLEDAVNSEDAPSTSAFLKVLEELNIPNEINIAYTLFGNLYRLHIEAKQDKQDLIDPNHPRFNGDFGRIAFQTFINGLEKKLNLQSIVEVRNSLKSTWQI